MADSVGSGSNCSGGGGCGRSGAGIPRQEGEKREPLCACRSLNVHVCPHSHLSPSAISEGFLFLFPFFVRVCVSVLLVDVCICVCVSL